MGPTDRFANKLITEQPKLNPVTRDSGEIQKQISFLENLVGRLERGVDTLNDRLRPVCILEMGEGVSTQPPEMSTPLGDYLQRQNLALDAAVNRLYNIIDRIQL